MIYLNYSLNLSGTLIVILDKFHKYFKIYNIEAYTTNIDAHRNINIVFSIVF